jgi:anti-sigma factor RsiW
MSCPVTTSLGAYALAALDPAEEEAVRRHLARCRRCADAYADLAGLVAMLHRLFPPAVRSRAARRRPRPR